METYNDQEKEKEEKIKELLNLKQKIIHLYTILMKK